MIQPELLKLLVPILLMLNLCKFSLPSTSSLAFMLYLGLELGATPVFIIQAELLKLLVLRPGTPRIQGFYGQQIKNKLILITLINFKHGTLTTII